MNMYNPYAPNPYIMQGQQQDVSGLSPVFQNIAQQQANQNMAMQQGQGITAQTNQSQQGGMNPMMMAQMLRKEKPQGTPTYTGPSYGTNPNFSNDHFNTMSYD